MKSKPSSCFLTYNLGKNLCENDIMKIFCSARLLIEIRFAVRKFGKSHNNKSYIELTCSVRIEKILVSFFQKRGTRPSSFQYGPQASSITYMTCQLNAPEGLSRRLALTVLD